MKKILIIGAGAVGQVYGYCLSLKGHQITFFIKEKYQEAMQQGLTLYRLNSDKHKKRPVRFDSYQTLTAWDQVNETNWHQIYICIPSTAFQMFDLEPLNRALSPVTTVILLQPGPHDYQRAISYLPKSQVVQGLITLCSFSVPLGDESISKPGIAYWLPPFARMPFTGSSLRRKEVVKTFRQAKIPARSDRHLRQESLYLTATFMMFIAALEASQWQFKRLKRDYSLQHNMVEAAKQAIKCIGADEKLCKPYWYRMLSPRLFRGLMSLAPRLTPFDLELFLQYHFTKVGTQTELFLQSYLDMAQKHSVQADALQVIVDRRKGVRL